MTRALLAVGIVGLTTFSAPMASATNTDEAWGGCGFNTNAQPSLTGNTYTGVLFDLSVTDDGAVVPAPENATVTCTVYVNGVAAPGASITYGDGTTPVQVGADPISYTAADSDTVWLAEVVHFADGTTWSPCEFCGEQIPPQRVLDEIDRVEGAVNQLFVDHIDPQVCPSLVSMAGTYGPITIQPDGDVYMADPTGSLNPLYDCPPYGNF